MTRFSGEKFSALTGWEVGCNGFNGETVFRQEWISWGGKRGGSKALGWLGKDRQDGKQGGSEMVVQWGSVW
jgi:hypothetical protein